VSQKPFPAGAKQLQGPFATKAEAEKAADAWLPGGTTGSGVAHDIGAAVTPLAAIGDFFHRLTEQQTWVRVGEVVAGGIVLFIAVKALVHQSGAAKATRPVTKPVTRTAKKAITVAVTKKPPPRAKGFKL
jgi:hypothetical protein